MKASHIVSALKIIQKQSPFHYTMIPHDRALGSREDSPEWNPPEAGLAWAIFERAALDHYVTGSGSRCSGARVTDIREGTAKVTALTGLVGLPNGRKVNILESIGIEPEWACGKLAMVANG